MILKKTIISAVAASALFVGTAAFAGKNTVTNGATTIPLAAGIALALNTGSSGTFTLADGQQVFVSASGSVVAANGTTVEYFRGSQDTIYTGSSPLIAGFLSSLVIDGSAEAEPTFDLERLLSSN